MAAPNMPTKLPAANTQKLRVGHQALFVLLQIPDLSLWEIAVKPPGTSGGGGIDTTDQSNVSWRTIRPRVLKTLKPFTIRAHYDPAVTEQLDACINVETVGGVFWPNGDTLAFYAFLDDTDYNDLTEDTDPQVTLTIIPTNWDYINCTEAGPVFTEATGTTACL